MVYLYLTVFTALLALTGCTATNEEPIKSSPEMVVIENFIDTGEIDSAYVHIQQMLNRKDQPGAVYDSALSLYLQIQKLYQLRISSTHIKVLLELDNYEYEALQKRQLDKSFLPDRRLNTVYMSELSRMADLQQQSEQADDTISDRVEYARELEQSYQDLGFEITITVDGGDNKNLTLTSVVFDDEWYQKFETSGELEEWHRHGFKKIEIRNGSGYSRQKSWP